MAVYLGNTKVNPKTAIPFLGNYRVSCAEAASYTQMSVSVDCRVGDLVIAEILSRSDVTIPDDWTLIGTSAIVSSTDVRLTWAYKWAESKREAINVSQASANRFLINLIAITGATGFVNNGFQEVTTAASSHTFTKPAGICLFGIAVQQWNTTSYPHRLWSLASADDIVQIGEAAPGRLAAFLLSDTDTSMSLTIPGGVSTKMYGGSLTIQGIDAWEKVN